MEWTKEDVRYLKRNYRTTSNPDMAAYLGRTRNAVTGKLSALHLTRSDASRRRLAKQAKGNRPVSATKRRSRRSSMSRY